MPHTGRGYMFIPERGRGTSCARPVTSCMSTPDVTFRVNAGRLSFVTGLRLWARWCPAPDPFIEPITKLPFALFLTFEARAKCNSSRLIALVHWAASPDYPLETASLTAPALAHKTVLLPLRSTFINQQLHGQTPPCQKKKAQLIGDHLKIPRP